MDVKDMPNQCLFCLSIATRIFANIVDVIFHPITQLNMIADAYSIFFNPFTCIAQSIYLFSFIELKGYLLNGVCILHKLPLLK